MQLYIKIKVKLIPNIVGSVFRKEVKKMENKIFTDAEILKALNNLKDIIQSQKELNNIMNKRLTNLEKFTLEKK